MPRAPIPIRAMVQISFCADSGISFGYGAPGNHTAAYCAHEMKIKYVIKYEMAHPRRTRVGGPLEMSVRLNEVVVKRGKLP